MNKRLVFSISLLTTITLAACGNTNGKHAASSSTQISSHKVSSAKKTSSKTSESTLSESAAANSSSSQTPPSDTAKQLLVGKDYQIKPTLFDGQDIDNAMNNNDAPQNIVHDGVQSLHFNDATTVQKKGLGSYSPAHTEGFSLTDNTLTIDQNMIPYTITGNTISFGTWTTNLDGHTITWQISSSTGME